MKKSKRKCCKNFSGKEKIKCKVKEMKMMPEINITLCPVDEKKVKPNDCECVIPNGCECTNNYNDLDNKPKINGIELAGDKSLYDLGLDMSNYYTKPETDAALDGKVSILHKNVIMAEDCLDFNLLPGGYCRVYDFKNVMLNAPCEWFNGEVFTGHYPGLIVQVAHDYHAHKRYYRDYGNDVWSSCGWIQLATAEPPTKYELPLLPGISMLTANSCYYYKTQDGIVHVVGCIKKTSELTNGDVVAFLPVGYRPAIDEDRPAVYSASYAVGLIRIAANGQVIVNFPDVSSQTQMFFELSFVAA